MQRERFFSCLASLVAGVVLVIASAIFSNELVVGRSPSPR